MNGERPATDLNKLLLPKPSDFHVLELLFDGCLINELIVDGVGPSYQMTVSDHLLDLADSCGSVETVPLQHETDHELELGDISLVIRQRHATSTDGLVAVVHCVLDRTIALCTSERRRRRIAKPWV